MRAAIYSRFSNADLQDKRSIEDQDALGQYAARHGFRVVNCFSDAGVRDRRRRPCGGV